MIRSAIIGLSVLLACCKGKEPPRNAAADFWRSDPDTDAQAALARGDSQFIVFVLPDSSMFVLQANLNLELNPDHDLRNVFARDLGMDSVYIEAHRDSIWHYVDTYNKRMLRVRILPAICGPGDTDSLCVKAAS